MLLVIIIHVFLILAVAILPFITWNKKLLLWLLFIHFTVSMQWHVLGGCILSPLESGTSAKESILVDKIAAYFGTTYEVIGKMWVVFQNYIPSLVCWMKLYLLKP
jgi:hypothetical protein